jgi:hypothetical protein
VLEEGFMPFMRQFSLPDGLNISSPLAWRLRHILSALQGS